jgi:hypothetical protein
LHEFIIFSTRTAYPDHPILSDEIIKPLIILFSRPPDISHLRSPSILLKTLLHRPVYSCSYIFVTHSSKMIEILFPCYLKDMQSRRKTSRLCNYSDAGLTLRQLILIRSYPQTGRDIFQEDLSINMLVNLELSLCPSTSEPSGVQKSPSFIERTWHFILQSCRFKRKELGVELDYGLVETWSISESWRGTGYCTLTHSPAATAHRSQPCAGRFTPTRLRNIPYTLQSSTVIKPVIGHGPLTRPPCPYKTS